MSRRTNTSGPSRINWQIRVTREEDDPAKALAEYLEESFSDMVRRLIREERKRLVSQGRRPPLRPKVTHREESTEDGA